MEQTEKIRCVCTPRGEGRSQERTQMPPSSGQRVTPDLQGEDASHRLVQIMWRRSSPASPKSRWLKGMNTSGTTAEKNQIPLVSRMVSFTRLFVLLLNESELRLLFELVFWVASFDTMWYLFRRSSTRKLSLIIVYVIPGLPLGMSFSGCVCRWAALRRAAVHPATLPLRRFVQLSARAPHPTRLERAGARRRLFSGPPRTTVACSSIRLCVGVQELGVPATKLEEGSVKLTACGVDGRATASE